MAHCRAPRGSDLPSHTYQTQGSRALHAGPGPPAHIHSTTASSARGDQAGGACRGRPLNWGCRGAALSPVSPPQTRRPQGRGQGGYQASGTVKGTDGAEWHANPGPRKAGHTGAGLRGPCPSVGCGRRLPPLAPTGLLRCSVRVGAPRPGPAQARPRLRLPLELTLPVARHMVARQGPWFPEPGGYLSRGRPGALGVLTASSHLKCLHASPVGSGPRGPLSPQL